MCSFSFLFVSMFLIGVLKNLCSGFALVAGSASTPATHSKYYLTAWQFIWNETNKFIYLKCISKQLDWDSKESQSCLAGSFPHRQSAVSVRTILHPFRLGASESRMYKVKFWHCTLITSSSISTSGACISVRPNWSKRRYDFLSLNLYYQLSAILSASFIRLSLSGLFYNYMKSGWSPIKLSVTRKRITALILSILTGM